MGSFPGGVAGLIVANRFNSTVSVLLPGNEPPTLSTPPQNLLVTAEDTPLLFSAANGNAITVGDPDAGANDVQISLYAENGGTITITNPGAVTFLPGAGSPGVTAQFTGTIAEVNAALDGLSFRPAQDFTYPLPGDPITGKGALLRVDVNDRGNTGIGPVGGLNAQQLLALTVTEVNDAPVAVVDARATFTGTTLTFPASDLTANDSVGPADEAGQSLTVTAVGLATRGTVALDGGTITYTPVAKYFGPDTFTYTVCDNGLTNGGSDARCATGQVQLTVSPISGDVTVTVVTVGSGTVSPATSSYVAGTEATFAAAPSSPNQIFVGWTLDGRYVGYANPLAFTVESNRTLVATFAPRPSFGDVPSGDPDYEAITRLAALGVINPAGVNGTGSFEPGRPVLRAEAAAFIARLFGWDDEFHRNTFPDQCAPDGGACVDDELWNNVAALADYGIVGGYTDAPTCASAGTTAPCYLPRDNVSRLQMVSIVARAFIEVSDLRSTGTWDRLPDVPGQYTNIPADGPRSDLATYRANAGPIPGQANDGTFPDPDGAASRRFVIQVLFQAFAAEFGTDRVP